MERPLAEWREIYLTRSTLRVHQERVKRARDEIASFLQACERPYVAWSAGKDSTALLHLAWTVDPNIRVMSEKDDMDFPYELDYVKSMQSLFSLNLDILTPPIKLWDVIHEFDVGEDLHSKTTSFSQDYFYGLIAQYRAETQSDGVLFGLRAEESKGRRMNRRVKGLSYEVADGDKRCQPIADWSASDVFAYLFAHDIPILPCYFQTKFHDSPEQIRKSWILPGAHAARGQAQWLKHYYPEIFMRLAKRNPELRRYV